MGATESGDTIRALVESRRWRDGVWLIAPETGATISDADLSAGARSLAAFLLRQGIAPGAHVAFLLPNGRQAARLFVGLMAAGYIAVPLNLLSQAEQLAWVIDHAEVAAVFVAPDEAGKLAGISAPCFIVDPDGISVAGETPTADWATPAPATGDTALLMYTSGTTGRPKGVVLSHANLLAATRFIAAEHALGPNDRVLSPLPLYHINALVVVILTTLASGGSVVLPRRFSASAFWDQASAHRCTWLNVVPTIVAYLLHGDTTPPPGHALRFCRSASAPLPPDQQRAFEARFGIGIMETLGLTETAGPVLSNPLAPTARRLGSPGRASGNEARIAAPDSGEILPDGAVGELQVRGPNVTTGYYRDPEATARGFTADGWLRTGDLARRDTDGFYFIVGRLKELIIKGGENIAPREIDEILLRHPAVLEAAAVGVPDDDYGQDIAAAVVLRPEQQCDADALRTHCLHHLGPFKTPRTIRFLDALPKGPSGKIQRLRVADLIR